MNTPTMLYTVEIWYTQMEEVTFDASDRLDLHETVDAYIDSNKPRNCIDSDWSVVEQLTPRNDD